MFSANYSIVKKSIILYSSDVQACSVELLHRHDAVKRPSVHWNVLFRLHQVSLILRHNMVDYVNAAKWSVDVFFLYSSFSNYPVFFNIGHYILSMVVNFRLLTYTRQVTRATHVRNHICPRVKLILKIIIILLIIFLGFIKSKPC